MDESGSMADQDRVTYARAAGIIIYDFCKAMDVPILIMGHTDDSNVQIYAYTDFDSMDKMDRYRLMESVSQIRESGWCSPAVCCGAFIKTTRGKEAVAAGIRRTAGRYRRLSGFGAGNRLRGIKKEYTNKGILFVASCNRGDKENIERIYGDAFLEISDLTKLPFLLVKKIEKELKG